MLPAPTRASSAFTARQPSVTWRATWPTYREARALWPAAGLLARRGSTGRWASALDTIFAVARTVDSKTRSLQYLDTLRALGASPATKLVIPMELTTLLQPLTQLTGAAMAGNGQAPSTAGRPRTGAPVTGGV